MDFYRRLVPSPSGENNTAAGTESFRRLPWNLLRVRFEFVEGSDRIHSWPLDVALILVQHQVEGRSGGSKFTFCCFEGAHVRVIFRGCSIFCTNRLEDIGTGKYTLALQIRLSAFSYRSWFYWCSQKEAEQYEEGLKNVHSYLMRPLRAKGSFQGS